MNKSLGERSFGKASIRALEGEGNERKFELSFSSEEPYVRWFGPEILSHADDAVDLTRLNEIGVLLFNHDADYVLGRIDRAWIENKRGKAEVTFDDDEAADLIYRKVKSGTLKGVSVRYSVDSWEEVAPAKPRPMDCSLAPATSLVNGLRLKSLSCQFRQTPRSALDGAAMTKASRNRKASAHLRHKSK